MIDKFPAIVSKEQRQLKTLGLALLVFLMTLVAQRLQTQVFRWSWVSRIAGGHATHASWQQDVPNIHNCMIALAVQLDDPP